MDSVRLNGRQLQGAVVLPVNPALDRDAVKAYLEMRKDGLDSIGVEVGGQHKVLVGKGLPQIGKADRLEISGKAAQHLYQENEINEFKEGFTETAKGTKGAAYLLGGLAAGGIGAYLATLAGFLTLPIGISMVVGAVAIGILAVLGRGVVGGLLAGRAKVDLSVTERMADPKISHLTDVQRKAIIGDASVLAG